jgi:uncharacterized protein Veg
MQLEIGKSVTLNISDGRHRYRKTGRVVDITKHVFTVEFTSHGTLWKHAEPLRYRESFLLHDAKKLFG